MLRVVLLSFILITSIFATENNTTNGEKKYELIIKGAKDLDIGKIADAVGVEGKDIFNFWSSKMIIKEKFSKDIDDNIKNYLEGIGYFKSNITVDKQSDKIIVTIDKGSPVKVESVEINSNFNIKKIVTFKKNQNFEPTKFVEIKDKIIQELLDSGYCQYNLNTKAYVDLDGLSAKLKYDLQKGSVCHFGEIKISKKPKDIDKSVILSRVKYKKGGRFSTKLIRDSYTALNSLDTFANLRIAYDLENNTTTVDTDLSMNKRKYLRRYMVALGADSEVGLRFKGSWEKRNFMGNAKRLNVSTEISKDVKKLYINLFTPALIGFNERDYLDLYLSFGYANINARGYKEKKIYYDGYLKYTKDKITARAGLGIENTKIDLKSTQPGIIGGTFYLVYPYIEIVYDNRDSKIDPKKGIYLKAYTEYGLANKSGGVQYLKYLLEARGIYSFGDLTLSAVGKIGAIHEVKGSLPASKLFLGGGLFSNRAYGKDKIGVLTSDYTFNRLGGKSYLNLQLEANYKLYKKLYGAIFYDRTIINAREYNWSGSAIDTIGFGLRYKTPIGPVKIDVGFNMHHRKDYAISVMLGQSF